ncbi:cell division regulator GpsB [Desertibacillus haloalkaliphilus]|uniref:cell division regulator GpsB n=1 Tax=Desertibacillus haloalkaliphilus TaxID=1328930 RepID=UPI001C27C405|nr:cell division regulator GpsB [Desertibacillus haloalkaliphilus]MBU8906053.1 cell division regulator GpsB [Desertibacillus haloalkaliphilus]
MNHDVRLQPKDILDKEFKTSLKGYNQDEVDKFLDIVIQDYELYEKKIEQLEQENEQLRKQTKKLSEPQTRSTRQTVSAGSTNYDILQRLSNLEKKVFGSKLYD